VIIEVISWRISVDMLWDNLRLINNKHIFKIQRYMTERERADDLIVVAVAHVLEQNVFADVLVF